MFNRIIGLLTIMLSAFVISYLTAAAFNQIGMDTSSLLTSALVIAITVIVLFVIIGVFQRITDSKG